MALVFIDGFDHYASAEVTKKGWSLMSAPTISSSYSRRSGIGQGMRHASNGQRMTRGVPVDDVYTVGFALRVTPVSIGDVSAVVFGESTNLLHVEVTVKDMLLAAYRGDDGVLLGSVDLSPFGFSRLQWNFYEVRVYIHDTAGTVTVRINGTEVLALTGKDTRNAGAGNISVIGFGDQSNSDYLDWDDLYISNGDSPDEFLGDHYVDTVFPDADGDVNDWTQNTGSRYQAVDDPTDIDDDTTYVSETTDEGKQLFSFGALSADLSGIKAVQEVITVRKDISPSVNIRPLFRTTGDSDYEGGLIALGDSYVCATKLWTANPDDSQDWEPTDIDNGQFGMIFTYTTTTTV